MHFTCNAVNSAPLTDTLSTEPQTRTADHARDAGEMLSENSTDQAAFQSEAQAEEMRKVFEENRRRAEYYVRHASKPRPWGPIEFQRRAQRLAWEKTGGRCFYCGMQVLGPGVGFWSDEHQCYGSMISFLATWLQVDHALSRKLGGRSNKENLRPSCPQCNQLKSGHAIGHFRKLFSRRHGSPFFYGEIAS